MFSSFFWAFFFFCCYKTPTNYRKNILPFVVWSVSSDQMRGSELWGGRRKTQLTMQKAARPGANASASVIVQLVICSLKLIHPNLFVCHIFGLWSVVWRLTWHFEPFLFCCSDSCEFSVFGQTIQFMMELMVHTCYRQTWFWALIKTINQWKCFHTLLAKW